MIAGFSVACANVCGYDDGYSIATASGVTIARGVARNGHLRQLVDSCDMTVGTNTVSSFAYAYDALDRPVQRNAEEIFRFPYSRSRHVASAMDARASTSLPAQPSLHVLRPGIPPARAEGEPDLLQTGCQPAEDNGMRLRGHVDPACRQSGRGPRNPSRKRISLLFGTVDSRYFFPAYDNIGNITEYIDESGSVVARYRHGAFGERLSAEGPMAASFHLLFSTKYLDPETGLYYYGERFYSPSLGRWLNRDHRAPHRTVGIALNAH